MNNLILLFLTLFSPIEVEAVNPLDIHRFQETLSLSLEGLDLKNPAIVDKKTNVPLLSQVTGALKNTLIFQADFKPKEKRRFLLIDGDRTPPNTENKKAFAMFVPQRKDDFAWENDRIAFRMYGPALEAETLSSGIDVWVKSVTHPILEKWYQGGDYHRDHGEGLDYYTVGPSRGCGGLGVLQGDQLKVSRNFKTWRILENGPIRTTFELTYAPWDAGGFQISETKRISLDLGSNLSRIESCVICDKKEVTLGLGLCKRQGGKACFDIQHRWLAYEQPKDPVNGTTSCGLVVLKGGDGFMETKDHLYLKAKAHPNKPFVYFAGACWSKSQQFQDFSTWLAYLEEFSKRQEVPIQIVLKKQDKKP